VTPLENNEDPKPVQMIVPQPRAAELYYKTCGKINLHNCGYQATFSIERKVVTNDWSMQVNLSIFLMIVVAVGRCTPNLSSATFNNNGKYKHKISLMVH
jgi:hypothetical protein